ncbi:multicopper oxidase family protein [Collimonas sp.]|uniref:multicopper oxidase family protein n=1 Tax=Collimonas sp. TaxID=1963772 RepID=UPI002CD01CE1|nr:multicopper oxidase family protein [Collimonas sp.]HWW05066.1 multicopper oxidase family protein [Collimonas sp.]
MTRRRENNMSIAKTSAIHIGYRVPAAVLTSLALFAPHAALADEPVVTNPPLLKALTPTVQPPVQETGSEQPRRLNLLSLPRANELSPGVAREVYFDLNIQYVNGWIRNPAREKPGEIKYDKVQLRSYAQGDGSPAKPTEPSTQWPKEGSTVYMAPEIEAYPGQTIRINLNNNLPRDHSCTPPPPKPGEPKHDINKPHCFNGTNLHSHGLWVNPAGNSDNVLLSINPGVGFQYEYNIPQTHPAGTFWYHTHRHGSTALQVSSGMAGPLIVRGTRLPTPTENGDLDTLLKPYGATTFPERVLVFQQIQYACRNAQGAVKKDTQGRYVCDAGDVGKIDAYDQFSSWNDSGRYTSINGVVMGTLAKAKAGEIERWRMIHGGVRDTISFVIRRLASNAPKPAGLQAAATEQYVNKYCTGPKLDMPLVAADGLTLSKALVRQSVTFQPGYRWDALVVFPEAGEYCVINDVKVADTVDQAVPSARLLGLVKVEPGVHEPIKSIPAYVESKLLEAAKANMPVDVQARIGEELRGGLKLSSFEPHRTIDPSEVTGTQTLVFDIKLKTETTPTLFQVGTNDADVHSYDPALIDRKLRLGDVDKWEMTSMLGSHPFHIHVNPVQIVSIIAPDGKTDLSQDSPQPDPFDDQFRGMKGMWKDTIWILNQSQNKEGTVPSGRVGKYTVTFRTRYERYIGDFVLHCHILDHEDQGMMQNVRIALPDGAGGVAMAHH